MALVDVQVVEQGDVVSSIGVPAMTLGPPPRMVQKWSRNGSVFVKTRGYWRRTLQAVQGRDPG